MPSSRQLAAIMFTDIVGYTALMGSDEVGALEMLRQNRQIHKAAIEDHQGKWLKEIGDAVLAQFSSAVLAVECAIQIQKQSQQLGAKIRIGIHLGDIAVENNDVYGDGVNIASRMQSIADPGGIYITEAVHNAIRSQADIKTRYVGSAVLKNVSYPVGTYCLVDAFLPVPSSSKIRRITAGHSIARKRILWLALGLLLTLVSALAVVMFLRSASSAGGIRSLVVLPIQNRTENPEISVFEEGIHDAIVNEVTKIGSLRVPSTRTSLKYKDSQLSIPEIARELNVDGVIEPSLFSMGDSVRIRIDLIAPDPERRLWSQEFVRDMPHILSLYADVATSLARELEIPLSEQQLFSLASRKEVIPKAYEAYIIGMSHLYKLTAHDLDQALRYFELAIELDPDYAPAYTGMVMVWGGRIQQGLMPMRDAALLLDSLMDRAIAVDSTLIEVNYTIALASTWGEWNWAKAGSAFKRAIEIDPNHAGVRAYYSLYLNIVGKPEAGMTQIERALSLDPFNPLFQAFYAMDLNFVRKFDEAIDLLTQTLEKSPSEAVALSTLRAAYHNNKQFDDAYRVFVRSYEVRSDTSAVRALHSGFEKGGYQQALISLAEFLIGRSAEEYVTPFQIGTLYTRAGDTDKAIEYLYRAYEEHDPNIPHINIDPIFDDLKKESRFRELINKMNFPGGVK